MAVTPLFKYVKHQASYASPPLFGKQIQERNPPEYHDNIKLHHFIIRKLDTGSKKKYGQKKDSCMHLLYHSKDYVYLEINLLKYHD